MEEQRVVHEDVMQLVAKRVVCSWVDFTDKESLVNTLYSLTGDFNKWLLCDARGGLKEYETEDKTASFIETDEGILCCKFYQMFPSLIGITLMDGYVCKAIPNGIVIEKQAGR